MTGGNCAIMTYWGTRIYLRSLGVPYAHPSGATASFQRRKARGGLLRSRQNLPYEVSRRL